MINKEVLKRNLPVLEALVNGRTIQFRNRQETLNLWIDYKDTGIGYPAFFDEYYEWRIKPEPSYRPWQPEEVPVGCVTRHKRSGNRSVIIGIDGQLIHGYDQFETACNYLNENEVTYDNGKTWQPCGVPV